MSYKNRDISGSVPGFGFSFLELLMAVFILFLVAISSLELFMATSRFTLRAKEYWTASFLAQSEMESLLHPSLKPFQESGAFQTPFTDYKYTLETREDDPPLKLFRVTVVSPSGVSVSLDALY